MLIIGMLFALKGGYFRAFYSWLVRDYQSLFGKLPERTRLQRALAAHQEWCDRFLAEPTLFTLMDTYGIELIHPIRERRSKRQIGRDGKSNWRWIVEVLLAAQQSWSDRRLGGYIRARLAYVAAMFNTLLALNRAAQPLAELKDLLHIAQYTL